MELQKLTSELRQLALTLADDTRLPSQRALCGKFNVTPFTLQQAFQALEREGQIIVLARKGVFVKRHLVVEAKYLQAVYLDHPQQRFHDRGLDVLSRQCQQGDMAFRAIHINSGNGDQLRQLLNQCANDSSCFGVVVGGCVLPNIAKILLEKKQPIVLFGDVTSVETCAAFPSVVCDHFQCGLVAVNELITHGFTHFVLLGYQEKKQRSWVNESYEGILASVDQHRQVEIYIPQKASLDMANIRELNLEVATWLKSQKTTNIAIICRQQPALIIGSSLVEPMSRLVKKFAIACLGDEMPHQGIPGVFCVGCTLDQLAETCLSRLAAIRRSIDTPGKRLIACSTLGTSEMLDK